MRKHEAATIRVTKLGRGVFSRGPFAAGDVVSEVLGRVICDPTYGSDYCIDLGDGRALEPGSPFRYLNHSCDPNCELVVWEEESGGSVRVCLHAVSKIRPGDELTIDYAWSVDSAIPCQCGSKSCRGWIVATDQLALL